MAAIDPGLLRSTARVETLLLRGTRIVVVAFYVTALVVALPLVRRRPRSHRSRARPAQT